MWGIHLLYGFFGVDRNNYGYKGFWKKKKKKKKKKNKENITAMTTFVVVVVVVFS